MACGASQKEGKHENCVLTVLRQDFFELLIVRVQSGETLRVYVLLQGCVSKPEEHIKQYFFQSQTPVVVNPGRAHSLLGQRLLLVDAHVEVHWLHPQQHAALDLSGQGFKHGPRQRDADIEAIPVPCDDRQQLGDGGAGCLGDLKGAKVHVYAALIPRWKL